MARTGLWYALVYPDIIYTVLMLNKTATIYNSGLNENDFSNFWENKPYQYQV